MFFRSNSFGVSIFSSTLWVMKMIFVFWALCHATFCSGQTKIESLIQSLNDYIDTNTIPGLSLSIVRSDTIIFVGGIGYADIERKEKVTQEHMFRLGSISKSYTALGLHKALEGSPYNLNTPIRLIDKDVPFFNPWGERYPVRVSHLLEHTSGFDDFHAHAVYNIKDSVLPILQNMVYDHRKSLKSRWKPGTRKAYSNPNYVIAGHLTEVLTKTQHHSYVKKNILMPLGMASSGYFFKPPMGTSFAQGYRRSGSKLNPVPFATINGSPAGGFCSNAKDMALYLQFMLKKDTTLFSKSTFDRIETPRTSMAAKEGLKFGYGLGNYTIWKYGYLFHGHGGQIDGFSARYLYSRDADLGISLAMNRNGDANALMDEILSLLFDPSVRVGQNRKTETIPLSIKNRYKGFYEFNSPRNELLAFAERMFGGFILDFEEDKVIRRRLLGRPKDTLYYAGDHQFYFEGEGVPSALLIEDNSGKPAFWIHDNYTEKASRTKRVLVLSGLLASFLLLTIFFVYALIWLLGHCFRKRKKGALNYLVLFGVGLSLIFMLLGFGGTMGNLKTAVRINFTSVLLYCSSYVLVLLSVLSVYRWNKLPKKKGFRVFYILTSIGAVTITAYLWDIELIGLKLWNY